MTGATWARFTDPAHDCPPSVHYARTDDTLAATVAGTSDGKEHTERRGRGPVQVGSL